MFLSLLDLLRQQGGWLGHEPIATGEPEVTEQGNGLLIRVNLPGVDPKSVQVQVTESSLTYGGYRTQEERVEADGYYHRSSSWGAFARTLALPERVVPHFTQALWLDDEVLEIRLVRA